MTRRLAWIIGLSLSFSRAARADDVFSPGDLAQSHQHLSGLSNCTQCHPAGGQLSPELCLACHKELKPSLAAGKGLHGRIPSGDRACEKCHHEHQGVDYDLLGLGPAEKRSFDHRRVGWPLLGKHLKLKCEQCHHKGLVKEEHVQALMKKNPQRHTFLGLGTVCTNCHFDEHRGQVSTDCKSCHQETGWKPAPGFKHDDTDYPLTGKHKRVACAECHSKTFDGAAPASSVLKPVSDTYLKYSPVTHNACTACHRDIHENRFGQRCQSCHTTEGWRSVKTSNKEREFHEKTRFPLRGEHADVECRSCHGPSPGHPAKFKNLAFGKCVDCHADAHFKQLKARGSDKSPDCDSCHNVDGFLPVQFDLAQHEKTRYPLEGAHRSIACLRCHKHSEALEQKVTPALTKGLLRRFRKPLFSYVSFETSKPERCDTCHTDVHGAQFVSEKKQCDSCHTTQSFQKLAFDHDKDTQFKLTGKHSEIRCKACHQRRSADKPVVYHGLAKDCVSCHTDIHRAQFALAGGVRKCDRCHSTQAWKSDLTFVHKAPFTDFVLDGKHADLKCSQCHVEVTLQDGSKVQRYKPLPTSCEGCHVDFHQGAFKGFAP